MKIGQIGKGFVGSALAKSFNIKGINTKVYDKFQKIGTIEDVLDTDIVFLCLPTPFLEGEHFDLSAIRENLQKLSKANYNGICVLKSTVEIGVTKSLSEEYGLNICHNPEFLTERTAFEDFHNQDHIVLGCVEHSENFDKLILLYKDLYPKAMVSVCSSDESEAMKIFVNNFYAIKISIFNEFYFLCNSLSVDFSRVKDLMLLNKWISPHHTRVPGPDGKPFWGGNCFVKDTHALLQQARGKGVPSLVLEAAIKERNEVRKDMTNIIKNNKSLPEILKAHRE